MVVNSQVYALYPINALQVQYKGNYTDLNKSAEEKKFKIFCHYFIKKSES
jgi:hypothetical protein